MRSASAAMSQINCAENDSFS